MPTTSLADLKTSALIELISGNGTSPGAGAAGAVTLALAAACGAKAVSISLKHSPNDARLAASLKQLNALRDRALQGADTDSQAFKEFLRDKSTTTARELVDAGETMAQFIEAIFSVIEEVEAHVSSSMKGDLVAARALAIAARTIQSANETEARTEEQRLLDLQRDS